MKKLILIGFSILAVGCTTPRPATSPKPAPTSDATSIDQKDGERRETPTVSDDTDAVKTEEKNRVTGYGEDPGEETQE